MTEERWVLMSEETFNDMRFGFDLNVDRVAEAVHSRPEAMQIDPNIHEHLNDGGIVVIHCA